MAFDGAGRKGERVGTVGFAAMDGKIPSSSYASRIASMSRSAMSFWVKEGRRERRCVRGERLRRVELGDGDLERGVSPARQCIERHGFGDLCARVSRVRTRCRLIEAFPRGQATYPDRAVALSSTTGKPQSELTDRCELWRDMAGDWVKNGSLRRVISSSSWSSKSRQSVSRSSSPDVELAALRLGVDVEAAEARLDDEEYGVPRREGVQSSSAKTLGGVDVKAAGSNSGVEAGILARSGLRRSVGRGREDVRGLVSDATERLLVVNFVARGRDEIRREVRRRGERRRAERECCS